MGSIRFSAVVERKRDFLPRFVVVASDILAPWGLNATTVVEVAMDGTALGRRTLKHWGKERDCWFFDLTEDQCRRAQLDTGARAEVELRLASTKLPMELLRLIESDPSTTQAWASLSAARQRMIAEHVRGAKNSDTRERRATRALAGNESGAE